VSSKFNLLILVTLKNALNFVVPQQQTVVSHFLFRVLTVLRLADGVVVAVVEVGHKRRGVLLSEHLFPVDVREPGMAHQLLDAFVAQPI
jgi:hypothetical protein